MCSEGSCAPLPRGKRAADVAVDSATSCTRLCMGHRERCARESPATYCDTEERTCTWRCAAQATVPASVVEAGDQCRKRCDAIMPACIREHHGRPDVACADGVHWCRMDCEKRFGSGAGGLDF
jgi:hypothetical protein